MYGFVCIVVVILWHRHTEVEMRNADVCSCLALCSLTPCFIPASVTYLQNEDDGYPALHNDSELLSWAAGLPSAGALMTK